MVTPDPTFNDRPTGIYPIVRLLAALALMTIGGSAMYATIVVLKPIAAEFQVSRGTAAIPYMLFMVGFGFGGIGMGRVADRFGIMPPILVASLALPAGFVASAHAASFWQFSLAIGVLSGLFGAAATFGPLVADISHWFIRRRGLAIAVVISGTYVAGALWPPILQYYFDAIGWRDTFVGFGIFALFTMLALSLVLIRKPPALAEPATTSGPAGRFRPLDFSPTTLQCLICAAGIGCCVAMAMPQVHIVPYATDLGHPAARGAEMLSLMLAGGIASRVASGVLADYIGGVRTLLLSSALQCVALVFYLPFDGLASLYVVSLIFGLSQGGIIPNYVIIIREYMPAREAGQRVGVVIMATIVGMAIGGWLSGWIYDLTGSYQAAFLNGIVWNLLNISIMATVLWRTRGPAAVPA
ncbi:MAG: MFS transporter [Planctomycetota bacterium]|nr:MFS transporter [Planctomycetota bacterium]